MNPAIKNRFTPKIHESIASHFGPSSNRLEDLNGFENFVYGFQMDQADFVLRVGHDARRPLAQVRSELTFLEYLKAGGADVAAPAKLEGIENPIVVGDGVDGAFIASVFERARGEKPDIKQQDASFFETYGRTLGRIHALSKNFQPAEDFDRPKWDSPSDVIESDFLNSDDREIVADRLEEVRDEIRNLPHDEERFGLIHQDPHIGNLVREGCGRITFFDFDDCLYGHFAYDIAMVFFYTAMFGENAEAGTARHFGDILAGYRRENALPIDSVESIPLFMKLREIDLYLAIHRSFDLETTDNERVKKFMQGRRDRIAKRTPWIDSGKPLQSSRRKR